MWFHTNAESVSSNLLNSIKQAHRIRPLRQYIKTPEICIK